MRPEERRRITSTIPYLPGFSAPRGRRRLSRGVRLARLADRLRGRRIDEYRNLFAGDIPGSLLQLRHSPSSRERVFSIDEDGDRLVDTRRWGPKMGTG